MSVTPPPSYRGDQLNFLTCSDYRRLPRKKLLLAVARAVYAARAQYDLTDEEILAAADDFESRLPPHERGRL